MVAGMISDPGCFRHQGGRGSLWRQMAIPSSSIDLSSATYSTKSTGADPAEVARKVSASRSAVRTGTPPVARRSMDSLISAITDAAMQVSIHR